MFDTLFCQLFWTQACPEGMRTNGTQVPCEVPSQPTQSHAQPVKVGHTTGVYVPYSFRIVMWVVLRPTRTNQWKCCETGPTVFRPYPRRLESLTICRCHYKDPECRPGRGLNPRPPARQTGALPTELTRQWRDSYARVSVNTTHYRLTCTGYYQSSAVGFPLSPPAGCLIKIAIRHFHISHNAPYLRPPPP